MFRLLDQRLRLEEVSLCVVCFVAFGTTASGLGVVNSGPSLVDNSCRVWSSVLISGIVMRIAEEKAPRNNRTRWRIAPFLNAPMCSNIARPLMCLDLGLKCRSVSPRGLHCVLKNASVPSFVNGTLRALIAIVALGMARRRGVVRSSHEQSSARSNADDFHDSVRPRVWCCRRKARVRQIGIFSPGTHRGTALVCAQVLRQDSGLSSAEKAVDPRGLFVSLYKLKPNPFPRISGWPAPSPSAALARRETASS